MESFEHHLESRRTRPPPEARGEAVSPADRTAAALRALSNPSRLQILFSLKDGEKTVGSLCADLSLTQAYVSQQLARLRSEELVTARRDGRRVFYAIVDRRILPVLDVIEDTYGTVL